MCFSMNAPITFSWISTEREKQIVLRANRLMRARSVRLLRSMRWGGYFAGQMLTPFNIGMLTPDDRGSERKDPDRQDFYSAH